MPKNPTPHETIDIEFPWSLFAQPTITDSLGNRIVVPSFFTKLVSIGGLNAELLNKFNTKICEIDQEVLAKALLGNAGWARHYTLEVPSGALMQLCQPPVPSSGLVTSPRARGGH